MCSPPAPKCRSRSSSVASLKFATGHRLSDHREGSPNAHQANRDPTRKAGSGCDLSLSQQARLELFVVRGLWRSALHLIGRGRRRSHRKSDVQPLGPEDPVQVLVRRQRRWLVPGVAHLTREIVRDVATGDTTPGVQRELLNDEAPENVRRFAGEGCREG
jgi:hypothetical protein